MKKLFSFLLISSFLLIISCSCPSVVHAQNVDGWFCRGLYMNGVTTGVPTNWRNINGSGIYGTDTTLYLNIGEPNYNVTWWTISCNATTVTTGTQGYVTVLGSLDGTNYFNIKNDTATKVNSLYTPWYKWTVANPGYSVFTGNRFPYRSVGLYILKGNTVSTVSCYYRFEKQYNGR